MFYRQRWNQRLHVRGASPDGYFMFGANGSRKHPRTWLGKKLGAEHLTFGQSSDEVEFVTAQTSDHVVLLVPPELLFRHFDNELRTTILGGQRTLTVGSRFRARFIGTIHRLVSECLANGELLADGRLCESMEFELLGNLAQACGPENMRFTHAGKAKRRKALLRALEYAEHLRRPIPVPELSAAAGVSQRTLEYAFEEAFGISPIKYLRWCRINQLRRELLIAEPDSTSITAATLRLGFSEVGRVAVEYRHLFGESPSTTLARRKTAPSRRMIDLLPSI